MHLYRHKPTIVFEDPVGFVLSAKRWQSKMFPPFRRRLQGAGRQRYSVWLFVNCRNIGQCWTVPALCLRCL